MKELNNLLLYFCYLIVLIFILIMIREYYSLNKNSIINAFNKF